MNVSTNSHNVFRITKSDFFKLNIPVGDKYDKGVAVLIWNVFERVYDVAFRRVLWNRTF